MPNAFDHRIFAGDSWSDMGAALAAGLLGATNTNGLDAAFPTGSTYTYGAAAGTTPAAFTTQPQFAPGSNAFRGVVYFNTGSSTPAGGTILTVTLPAAVPIADLNVLPYGWVSPRGISLATSQASAAWTYAIYPVMTGANFTGFTLATTSTITASQGTATAAAYGVAYLWFG